MSGYREHSFDPNQYEPVTPLRPFNWVQWLGVGLDVAGVLLMLAYAAGRLGWIGETVASPMLGPMLMLVGLGLINSRRAQAYDPAPELAADRRRWLVIVLIASAALIGAAAILEGAF